MGNCLGTRNGDAQLAAAEAMNQDPPLTEEEQSKVQIARIELFIDAYNTEVEKLNANMATCNKRALEYKRQGNKQLAMFFINKRKILEQQASNYTSKSMMLSDRKSKMEQLEAERDFFRVMKEANDILEKHLNQNTIDEIRRFNEISGEVNMRDDLIKQQRQEIYSPDIEDEFANLESSTLQKKVTMSMAKSVPKPNQALNRQLHQDLLY